MSFYSGTARMIMAHFCIWDILTVSVALVNVNVNTLLFEHNTLLLKGIIRFEKCRWHIQIISHQ